MLKDIRFSDEKIAASRNFANKIWNAARFIRMNLEDEEIDGTLPDTLSLDEQWIVSAYNRVVREVTENLEKFELGIAVQKVYDFLWDVFCDWYIEIAKIRMQQGDRETALGAKKTLVYVFSGTMKLLHPFMPFITEEIWQSLPHEGDSIMVSEWPKYDPSLENAAAQEQMENLMEAIRAVRARKAEMNVPTRKTHLYIATAHPDTYRESEAILQKLSYSSEIAVADHFEIGGAVSIVTADARLYLPMAELVDRDAELARLGKELAAARKQLDTVEAKLRNEAFMSKAPQNIIDGVRQNGEKLSEKIRMIESEIQALG